MRLQSALFFFVVVSLASPLLADAQDTIRNPEIRQMYENGLIDLDLKDYRQAHTVFSQALTLAPGNNLCRWALAEACLLEGDYSCTMKTLDGQLNTPEASPLVYHLLAMAQAHMAQKKEAAQTLETGLKRFPASGDLLYDRGMLYSLENEPGKGLDAWLQGIAKAPQFAANYRAAALALLQQGTYAHGLLLLEVYLCMPHPDAEDDSLKRILFQSYKSMLETAGTDKERKVSTKQKPGSFAETFDNLCRQLTPVVSDGTTTENLTMFRARLLMRWHTEYRNKLPLPFFDYLFSMIGGGKFEIYNEWLFGKAEGEAAFVAWNSFHAGDIDRFLEWRSRQTFVPGQLYLHEVAHAQPK